jgi:translation initiation factor IF-2
VRRDAVKARVRRSGAVIWEGRLHSVRVVKQSVEQVGKGTECGIMFEGGWEGFQVGDTVEVLELQQRRPKTADSDTGGVKIDE